MKINKEYIWNDSTGFKCYKMQMNYNEASMFVDDWAGESKIRHGEIFKESR